MCIKVLSTPTRQVVDTKDNFSGYDDRDGPGLEASGPYDRCNPTSPSDPGGKKFSEVEMKQIGSAEAVPGSGTALASRPPSPKTHLRRRPTFAEDPPSPKMMPRGAQFKPTAARSVAPAIGGRRGPPKFPDHSDLALPGIEWQSALKYRRVP